MKPSRRRSDFFHKLFEATIDYTVREESPNFIGKYKVLFCPTLSRFEPLSVLFQFLKPEQFHHRGRKRQSSGFVVLGLGEVKLAVLVLLPAKLLLYRQRSIIQVQALPGKPQNLPLPNPCKKCDFIQVFIRVSMDCFQELGNLVIVQGLNVLFLYTGKLASVRGVYPNHTIFDRLLQRLVKNPVNVLDRLWRKRFSALLVLTGKLVIKLLNHRSGQGIQFDRA